MPQKFRLPSAAMFNSGFYGPLFWHSETRWLSRMRAFKCVGWVERSETHHVSKMQLMGIASLNPSYALFTETADSITIHDIGPRGGIYD